MIDPPKGLVIRERLLDSAEKHFAEYGFHGASQRAILRDVNLNAATANYYFGTKEALFVAVVERYLPGIVERRAALWAAIPARLKGRKRLEAMLRAYIQPHIEVATTPQGRHYGGILARLAADGANRSPDAFLPSVAPFRKMVLGQLVELFPGVDPVRVGQALSYSVTLMLSAPYDRNYESTVGLAPEDQSPEAWTEALTRFAMGGFEGLCGAPR